MLTIAVSLTFVWLLIKFFWGPLIWLTKAFWEKVGTPNQVFFIELIIASLAGLLVTVIAAYLQREAWKKDVISLTTELTKLQTSVNGYNAELVEVRSRLQEVKSGLAEDLTALHGRYEDHLNRLVPALGGKFTESLFGYHPFVSAGIAKVLSNEVRELFEQYHQRVMVRKGADTYRIDRLEKFRDSADTFVWKLAFHITWEWFNDSQVTKFPLQNFWIIALATPDAARSYDEYVDDMTQAAERRKFTTFLEERENSVLATLVNPVKPARYIERHSVSELFGIDRITVSVDDGVVEDLTLAFVRTPDHDLPDGIYSALSLQADRPRPLKRESRMRVDYVGTISLIATKEGEHTYRGSMTYPPADIIKEGYYLRLLYPEVAEMGDGAGSVKIQVLQPESGCQYIHGWIEHHPSDRVADRQDVPLALGSFNGKVATIEAPQPLTNLHRLSMVWKGRITAK